MQKKILVLSALGVITAFVIAACNVLSGRSVRQPPTVSSKSLAQTATALSASSTPLNPFTPTGAGAGASADTASPPAPTATPVPAVTILAAPTLDSAIVIEAAVNTLSARMTEEALRQPTSTPASTSTPAPVTTPKAGAKSTATATAGAPPGCNMASFETDVTIPDLTVLYYGETFTKTWRVKNAGTCTWTTDYELVFSKGYNMHGPWRSSLPRNVAPGESIDLSVDLIVPPGSGWYTAAYMLADKDGNLFGVGKNGSDPLTLRIQTTYTPTPYLFAVTNVNTYVDSTWYSTTCPPGHTFHLTANITTNGPGQVTYRWLFSNGHKTAANPIIFNAAGTKTVTYNWTLGEDGDAFNGSAQIYIDEPNHQKFDEVDLTLYCTR